VAIAAPIWIVRFLPNLSMVKPPCRQESVRQLPGDHAVWTAAVRLTIKEPKTAPPEKVELIAPMIALVLSVLKKSKKLGESMTWMECQFLLELAHHVASSIRIHSPSVITPESYPKRKDLAN
jgi:hypothetical protein